MRAGQRERYRATGPADRMKGRGRDQLGRGHSWRGHRPHVPGPEWATIAPLGFGLWSGEPTDENELAFLKRETEAVKDYLGGLERRIDELEKKTD